MESDCLHCFICMEVLQDAHICPTCSKLCCYGCIGNWLNERNTCPQCQSELNFSKLIKCRWADDVAQDLERMNLEVKNLKAMMEEMSQERDIEDCLKDSLAQERELLEQAIEKTTQEQEILSVERNVLQQERNTLAEEIEKTTQERELIAVEREIISQERKKLEAELKNISQERNVEIVCKKIKNPEIKTIPREVVLDAVEEASRKIIDLTNQIKTKLNNPDDPASCNSEIEELEEIADKMTEYKVLMENKTSAQVQDQDHEVICLD